MRNLSSSKCCKDPMSAMLHVSFQNFSVVLFSTKVTGTPRTRCLSFIVRAEILQKSFSGAGPGGFLDSHHRADGNLGSLQKFPGIKGLLEERLSQNYFLFLRFLTQLGSWPSLQNSCLYLVLECERVLFASVLLRDLRNP